MTTMMRIRFRDEELEHWGRVYLEHPELYGRGITFDMFLQEPEAALRFLHSLEATRQAEARHEAMLDKFVEIHRRNGQLIEPLRHHAFPFPRSLRRVV